MKRLLTWLVGIPAAVIIVGLAVANRQMVTFSIDPFSQTDPIYAASVPLFALLLASIFVGLIFGGVASWLSQGRWRKAAREARTESSRLKHERDMLKRQAVQAETNLLASSRGNDALPPGS